MSSRLWHTLRMGSVASGWKVRLTKLVVAPEQAKELPPVSKDDKDFLYAGCVSGTASSDMSRTKVHVLSTRSTSEPDVVKGMRASMGPVSGDKGEVEEKEEADREQCQMSANPRSCLAFSAGRCRYVSNVGLPRK